MESAIKFWSCILFWGLHLIVVFGERVTFNFPMMSLHQSFHWRVEASGDEEKMCRWVFMMRYTGCDVYVCLFVGMRLFRVPCVKVS